MSNDDLVTRLRLLSKWMEDVGFVVAEADEAAARITELEAELDAAEIERGKARRIILDLRAEQARLREAGNQLAKVLDVTWAACWCNGVEEDERSVVAAFAAWAGLSGEPTS